MAGMHQHPALPQHHQYNGCSTVADQTAKGTTRTLSKFTVPHNLLYSLPPQNKNCEFKAVNAACVSEERNKYHGVETLHSLHKTIAFPNKAFPKADTN